MQKQSTDRTNETEWNYICTRPTIASLLIREGFKYSLSKNPWKPERDAWIFHIDEELALIVSRYYTNIIQKEPPVMIQRYLCEVVGYEL